MRLLILTALYPPATGGAATYYSHIAPLIARKEEVEQMVILTERMPGEPAIVVQDPVMILRLLPTRASIPRRSWLFHALTYIWTQLWFVLFLPRLVQRYEIDLIHFHTRYQGFLFYWSLSRCRVPILADLRDKITDPAKLVTVAKRLICCSQGIYECALAGGFSDKNCSVIPVAFESPTILTPEKVANIQQQYRLLSQPYIIFVGDITFNKGIYELLEAFDSWRANHPEVQLIIAGTNREGEKFKQIIKEMSQVTYFGRVPHQTSLSLIQGSEMLILPSRSEGLPRVILEAISLRIKVVCPPNIPEFEQYLPAYTLPEVSVDSLVKTMETVWLLPDAPNYPLENHSLDKVADKLMVVYQNLI